MSGRWEQILDDPSGPLRYAVLLPAAPEPSRFAPGDEIERWRLVAPLGRGGMGEVFLAERTGGDFAQRVALKLLRPGSLHPALYERFLQERRILARLDHPGIARLVDGGVAPDGSPFLAVEHVDGVPLTDWCRERRATVDERLRVLLEICDAVQYAHGQLVVHRDLKPANALVDRDGHARLLDFGIAKLLLPPAQGDGEPTMLRALTPSYASPEQIRGEPVSAATDVWALGVLLFELLAGVRPFGGDGADTHAVERAVLEREPVRPSAAAVVDGSRPEGRSLPRRLRGDLDRIALRALAKEPDRRYASVEALAADLRRHLAGLPVEARGDALGYRAGKFVRRHALGVAAALTLVATLAAGLGATAWQATRARHEAQRARLEAARAQSALQFLADLFALSDPAHSGGHVYTDAELLRIALDRVGRDFVGKPDVQAPLYRQLALVFQQRGEPELGIVAARRALGAEERLGGVASPAAVRDRILLASASLDTGKRPQQAEWIYRGALAALARSGRERSQDGVDALVGLAQAEDALGKPEEMERLGTRAVALTRELRGETSAEYAQSCATFGSSLLDAGFDAVARPYLETAARLQRQRLGLENPSTLLTLIDLSILTSSVGEDARAREILREVLPVGARVLGRDRNDYLIAQRVWARLEERAAHFAGAVAAMESVLAAYRARGREGQTNYAFALNQYAVPILTSAGRLADAEAAERAGIAVFHAVQGKDPPTLLVGLGKVLIDRGDLRAADQALTQALALQEAAGDRTSSFHAAALYEQGRLAIARGDLTTARARFEEDLTLQRAQGAGSTREAARALAGVASTLAPAERAGRCRALLGEAAAIDARILAASHPERQAIERALTACP